MTTYTAQHLYELLPAIYRLRDAEQGGALKQLVSVLAREIGLVEDDIAQLYTNWFIETCDEWVVPYIGDLLGVRGLHPISTTEFTQRAFVANTLSYRRRKGTATVLEQLARDTTLWDARAVEFFDLLSTTQYINHLRPQNVRTPDLRQMNQLELLNTPFDTIAHTAEVRHIANQRGRYNIPNVGLFLWRLQAYPLLRSTPHALITPADARYTFSSLGHDAPLFNQPQTEATITHLAEEINVPGELRRRALYDDLAAYRQALLTGKRAPFTQYFGAKQPVLEIYFDGQRLLPETFVICNLSGWDAPGWEPPTSETFNVPTNPMTTFETKVAIDPALGRLSILKNVTNPPADLAVSYAYGFSGDLGGGPYDRRLLRQPGEPVGSAYENSVAQPQPNATVALLRVPGDFTTLNAALAAWDSTASLTVIQIEDDHTYAEDLSIGMGASDLVIQARNGQRPTWIGNLTIQGNQQGRLALNGLLIAGNLTVAADESLRQLDLLHCTLVPGLHLQADGTPSAPTTPSLLVNATNIALHVNLVRSITGPLRLPTTSNGLTIQESLIEAPVRDRPAIITPALVSGNLSTFPTLTSAPAMVKVTIGEDGPYPAILAHPSQPTTLAQARDALQNALQKAHPSPAFTQARVVNAANRLIVLPGVAEPISLENTLGDQTADLLRLSSSTSQPAIALVSGELMPFPTLTAATPAVTVQIGDLTRLATFTAVPTSLAQARDRLQEAIRAADPDPAFANALVSLVDNQLVVLPGVAQTRLRIDGAPSDSTTATELALESDEWAIAGDETGLQPGPPTTLIRATVLGPVHVKELTLASEVIFVNPVITERRQAGCVRFSYVPENSRTPRRYRCQPDLAVSRALDAARAQGALTAIQADAIHQQVLGKIRPSFTSTRYGSAAYGQLSLTCPVEITNGAEDSSEMGAFSFLKQPQRAANLRASLEEYLRFGLEAGIFYVT
ncbi:MAG: phage tail protein [Chloroflexi bacterium]|nr:phage tail protein [Chloroflexota bacterium]